MQCACSRNSALFKVVPLLELKTRGDAGHQKEDQKCGLYDNLRSPNTLISGMSLASLTRASVKSADECRRPKPISAR
jgi:hypothetical protein